MTDAGIISSLVNLGSAGAVIIVVIIFLRSMKERDDQWRDFFTAINTGNQSDITDMRTTAEHLTRSLDNLVSLYSQHDTRAQNIQTAVDAIRADVAKMTRPPNVKARGN